MTNRTLVMELRAKGMSLSEIGRLLGVSRQAVHQLLNRRPSNRHSLGKKIIYPNLLDWSIEHDCSREEFISRMGLPQDASSHSKLCKILNGKVLPKKDFIDKMIEVTGLPYEKLFEVVEDGD